MRILMTTDTVGGVWTFTKELASGLLNNDCDVALVSLGRMPSSSQQSWADEQSSRWGARFRYAALDTPLEWMQDNQRALSSVAPALMRIIDEFNPELVLSSQYCFGALRCDIPRIVIAHSDVLSWAEACRPRGLDPSDWLNTYIALVQAGLDGADAVVAPTRWMLDALDSNFSLPSVRQVIANGRTLPGVNMTAKRRMQAVTAGRLWDEAKNIKLLEDLDSPIPLLIAGETGHKCSSLTAESVDLHLLGPLDENAMLSLFRESAIYICTSRYEPFGLAPLEAAQCGCAVLANDIPSLREVWGDAALYFTGPQSLSSWLWRLSDHPWLLNEAREIGATHAREFTTERMTEGYLDLFRSILKQSSLVATHVA